MKTRNLHITGIIGLSLIRNQAHLFLNISWYRVASTDNVWPVFAPSNMLGFTLLLLVASPVWCRHIVEDSFQFKHHSNAELLSVLESVHHRCPNITRVYTLNEKSVLGNPLLLIEFSRTPGVHQPCKF